MWTNELIGRINEFDLVPTVPQLILALSVGLIVVIVLAAVRDTRRR